MINIFFPIFDKIDNWIESIFPFSIQNLFWGIIAGSLAFLIYWLLSDQTSISEIKIDTKKIRKKMFDSSLENKSEYNELAKKNLSLSFRLLGKIFLPAIISITPVIIIALWYDMNHSYIIPFDSENIAITSVPNNVDLDIEPYEITSKNIAGNTYFRPLDNSNEIKVYANDALIYSGTPFIKPIPYIIKKKWWNSIISSPVGYLSSESKIEVIFFNYPEKVLFGRLPHWINGWELLFFVGIFISAMPLRIIFKVK